MKIRYSHRPPTAPTGRFGGGWQWKLGIQGGGKTILVSLFVIEIRVDRR